VYIQRNRNNAICNNLIITCNSKWKGICGKYTLRCKYVEKNELGGAYSTYGGQERCKQGFGGEA